MNPISIIYVATARHLSILFHPRPSLLFLPSSLSRVVMLNGYCIEAVKPAIPSLKDFIC